MRSKPKNSFFNSIEQSLHSIQKDVMLPIYGQL